MSGANRTRKIKAIFNELEADGKLPIVGKRGPINRQRCRQCKRYEDFGGFDATGRCTSCRVDGMTLRTAPITSVCCLDKYGNDIPNDFKVCHGCPRELDFEAGT
jgi:hypothetical protein